MSNKVNEFLWSCAGVNKDILRLYPSEYAKYAGSGGTILFTALMAMFSGGYAMFFVFDSVILSVIFAIFWGLLIFNLDRFIVNSMHTDGKDTISLKKLKAASPRIIMAVFLGLVISTPLEMKIFNDRIESLLIKDNIERVNEVKSKSLDYDVLLSLQAELLLLSTERKLLTDELLKALKELKEEAEGNALSGHAGHGAIYRDKEVYVNQCKQSLQEWDDLHQERLKSVQTRILEVLTHILVFEGRIDDLKEDGFSARYEAFANLKDSNKQLATVSLMITILFIIIEITPTFFKLIMTSGPYDEHSQMDSFKIKAYTEKEKNNIETELLLTNILNKKKIFNEQYEQNIYGTLPAIALLSNDNIYTNNQKPITYGTETRNNDIEEVPYILKSNTSIKTVKKPVLDISTVTTNKKGQIVLNFSSKSTI